LHSGGLGEDLGVREAQNGEALAGEPSFALRVVLDTVDMDRPVRFDHTCSFVTKEVHDEAADRSLPAELRAQKLAAAHELPEHPFCRRLVGEARAPSASALESLPPFGRRRLLFPKLSKSTTTLSRLALTIGSIALCGIDGIVCDEFRASVAVSPA
jgi:hypothetical protein